MKKIYFGHSRMLYGKQKELDAIWVIIKHYPEYMIINPNIPEHQENCRQKIGGDYTPGKEIGYFLRLTDPTDIGCFLPYDENKWSAGSAAEAKYMKDAGKSIFLINIEDETLTPITEDFDSYTFEETSKKLGESGIKHLM
jgi:hypothetical protein